MGEKKYKGAILVIGSLAWENEENAINKAQGKIRTEWRENHLNMGSAVTVKCPIRYGRRSGGRYNTDTMVFSEGVLALGTALLVPLKAAIDLSDEHFEALFSEAKALAVAEGINKNDDNLYKSWGTVSLRLTDGFKQRDREMYDRVKIKWQAYFNNAIKPNEYRAEGEQPIIDPNSLLTKKFDGEDEFDFILTAATKPERSEYPRAAEIVAAMINGNYYTYFLENRQSGITTFQDHEILSLLPGNITNEKKNGRLDIEMYQNNAGGYMQLGNDLRISLGRDIYARTKQTLCYFLLTSILGKGKAPSFKDDVAIQKACEQVLQQVNEHFEMGYKKIPKDRDSLFAFMIKELLDFDKLPGEERDSLKEEVIDDLKEITALIEEYEQHPFIKEHNQKQATPRSQSDKTVFEFYQRCIKEQRTIIHFLLNEIDKRGLLAAKPMEYFSGAYFGYSYLVNRDYYFAMPFGKQYFDYRRIDLCKHRLMNVPLKDGRELAKLYEKDKKGFYEGLQKYMPVAHVFHEIRYYLKTIPLVKDHRQKLFEELEELFNEKKWHGVYALALGQIEGLFQEMLQSAERESKASALPDKVQGIRKYTGEILHLDYYQYHLPELRNRFMHSGIDTDLELKSYDALYDVHYLLQVFAELQVPKVKVVNVISRSDLSFFSTINDIEEFVFLLEAVQKSKQFEDIREKYSDFEKTVIAKDSDFEFLTHQFLEEYSSVINKIFDTILDYTTRNATPFDLRASTVSLIKKDPQGYRNRLQVFYEGNYELFEKMEQHNKFLSIVETYFPSLSQTQKDHLKDIKKYYANDIELINTLQAVLSK